MWVLSSTPVANSLIKKYKKDLMYDYKQSYQKISTVFVFMMPKNSHNLF